MLTTRRSSDDEKEAEARHTITKVSMNDFQKLSDCIAYYQTYHLTKHKYQWRANALKYFDCFPLDQLRRFHVKQYFALRSVESLQCDYQ